MKYINFAATPSDIKVAIIVHPNEFSKKNIERNLITLFPTKYKNSIAVLSIPYGSLFTQIIDKLNTLPRDCIITFTDLDLYKKVSGLSKLPKLVGKITPSTGCLVDKHVQYFNYSSKSLYMYSNLEINRKCVNNIVHLLDTGSYLATQEERKLVTPESREEAKKFFKYLLKQPLLGADIETTSLKFYEAELVSISFAVDHKRGFTFHVKHCEFLDYLKEFFIQYKGKIAWHGGSYDIKVLAFLLFDSDSRTLFKTYEDTLFLHYICTNSPERFPRDLGTLTVDLLGEYKLTKKEITNMMNVDPQKVCEYNLDDARGTYWLYTQWRNKIHSEYLYDKFKKWQWALTQAELVGIPFSEEKAKEVDEQLTKDINEATIQFNSNPFVKQAAELIREGELIKANAKRVKPLEITDIPLTFNTNSSAHLTVLFFKILNLPVGKKTKSGQPSTDSGTLKKLKVLSKGKPYEELFDLLDTISKATKLQSTFIKALKTHSYKRNGHSFLCGGYNLAKVVSGRLSSSDPSVIFV